MQLDCSLQRRHQKLVEEAPAPAVSDARREEIHQAAVTLARNISYENAGTVEFIFDQEAGTFYFLEMNAQIQVEHPVTEMITGIDLVQDAHCARRSAAVSQTDVKIRGHAIECRITAKSPTEGFRQDPTGLSAWRPPEGPNIRLDTHCFEGYAVPIFYDSMLAKLIVYGSTRMEAIERMQRALGKFSIAGVETILPFLRFVMNHADFAAGKVNTHLVEELLPEMLAQLRNESDR